MWDLFEDMVVGVLLLALIKILNDIDIEDLFSRHNR